MKRRPRGAVSLLDKDRLPLEIARLLPILSGLPEAQTQPERLHYFAGQNFRSLEGQQFPHETEAVFEMPRLEHLPKN